ncbi:hypothetical protein QP162_05255 [Sphingomonas aurantiaca]|uniref:hypothetical protein n=1 Tax=Sphingomonas aurantiaca TaxID=185949 RepID=UPI002FE0F88F
MSITYRTGLSALAVFALAALAMAGNTLIPPGLRVAVAKSAMTVVPSIEWNKLGARPGRNSESWTQDGDDLNDLTFYGGIEAGRPLFREVDKKNQPLPKVSATMLITDIPVLLENSYRVALGAASFKVDLVEPLPFAGNKGVRFTYSFEAERDAPAPRRGARRGDRGQAVPDHL